MLEGVHLLVGLVRRIGSTAGELELLSGAARWGPLALSGCWVMSSNGGEAGELLAGSLALRAGERLSLGVGLKRYHRSSAETEATQIALDLGLLHEPVDSLSLGVNFGNVVHSGEPPLTPLTRLGARLELGWLRGAGELAFSPTAPPQGKIGAEFGLFSPLVLRLGWAAGHWSCGLGVNSGRLNADFALLAVEEGPVWMLSTEAVFRG
jgi:hypothetical protein